jgi:ElaB/YqjD/DUF883 family membrane-anchored ribosome-binding protein
MNTSAKPYSAQHPGSTKSPPLDTLGDTARSAIEATKDTMADAMDRGQAAVSQAGTAASDMADSATHQMKTFASELDAMAKRNPLGTLAGAVIAGVLIGVMVRGRS